MILVMAFSAIYVTSYQTEKHEQDQMRSAPISIAQSRFNEIDRRVIMQERIKDSDRSLRRLLGTLIITGLATMTLAFGVSWYFAEESIKPVRDAWLRQKQFITDASHELKTPLAAVDASFDALLADHKIKSKWTLNIRGELTRMNKLVSDLLYLARFEDSDIPLDFDLVDLSATVESSILSMEALAYEKGVSITSAIEEGIIVRGNEEKLRQVVTILGDNAIKYSEKEITIDLKKQKSVVIFSVRNDGQMIRPRDLPHIFDRFYRSDKSRSSDGYGLGLPIAKAIVEKHGGKIRVTSSDGSTCFSVSMKI